MYMYECRTLPEVIAAEDHTYNILSNIMYITFNSRYDNSARESIL